MLQEFNTVRLLTDLPDFRLERGAAGVILMIHRSPELAYQVEVGGADSTFAVGPQHVELVRSYGS